jgi:RNA polymerase sigma factor (sigma-70 family)
VVTDARSSDPADTTSLQVVPTFEALFVEEYPKMVALAAAVSGDRGFAEDLAQEAMHRLHRNWGRVQGYESPGAWVRRVTINLAISQRRRLVNETRARLRLGVPASVLPPSAAEHEPVWRAVRSLPGKQRAAIALRYLEDRTIEDIADILEISPATARVHLHRGRRALRDLLPDPGSRPGSEPPSREPSRHNPDEEVPR